MDYQSKGTIYYGTSIDHLEQFDQEGIYKPMERNESYISVSISGFISSVEMAHEDLFQMAHVFEKMGLCTIKNKKMYFKSGYENTLTYIQGFGPNPSEDLHSFYGMVTNERSKSTITAVVSKVHHDKLRIPDESIPFEHMSCALHGFIEKITPDMIMCWIVPDQHYETIIKKMNSGLMHQKPLIKSSSLKKLEVQKDSAKYAVYPKKLDLKLSGPMKSAKINHLKRVLKEMNIDWSQVDIELFYNNWLQEHKDHIIWDEKVYAYHPKSNYEFLASNQVWDVVSKDYSQLGPDYWQWFGNALVKASALKKDDTVLDIAFGRGASLIEAAKQVKHIDGIEASSGMVYYTKKQLRNLNNINLICHDAVTYPYPIKTYDCILNGFGMGILRQDNTLIKIKDALKDNGVLMMTQWAHQEDQFWISKLVNKYLEIDDDLKVHAIATKQGLEDVLKPVFSNVEVQSITQVFYFENKEQWWSDLEASAVKNIMVALENKHKLSAFKQEIFESVEQFKTKKGYAFRRDAFLIKCEK